jgi:hypothetical protein
MPPKLNQLELFGTQSTDFGNNLDGHKAPDPAKVDCHARDPTDKTSVCQGKKIDLTEVQLERARALHCKSKALVLSSINQLKESSQG